MSLMNWQKDFFRYFSEIGLALRVDPLDDSRGGTDQYIRRFDEWKVLAKYPDLVSSVHILKAAGPEALRMDSPVGRFVSEAWPPEFGAIRADLTKAGEEYQRVRGSEGASQALAYRFNGGDPSTGGWRFEPSIPALFHPIILAPAPSAPRGETVDWIAVKLNQQEIKNKVIAELSQTYFQGTDGLDYLVAVISPTMPGHVIYSSDPGFGEPEPADADGVIDVFGRPPDRTVSSPVHVFHMPPDNKGPAAGVRISWFPLLRESAESLDWRLVVRHRRGGALGAFVVEMRRRDLTIGFGVLLVLVLNLAMLIVTIHRAQRLAQLQMDFVTAVSHELRTPLTVIISGADNIRNGIVETTQQMVQYGTLIGRQARQLFGLVERILLFASTRQSPQRYDLKPLNVKDVVDTALTSSAELIEADNFVVERDIDPNLPLIRGDQIALAQCLQNLIVNALKYGKQNRWIGIRASLGVNGKADKEVQISVSDRGMGISKEDLSRIFEPFYRSPAVRAEQIHGTGLGLPLSQSIVEAMNGRLTVTSAPGQGSTFTMWLPSAPNLTNASN
jgi:signal transduction histidine kinase